MESIKEEWKLVPQTEGYYISNFGRMKIEKSKKFPNGRLREADDYCIDKDGYYRATFRTIDGKSKFMPVHRLVALLFIPNSDKSKNCVNHIDNNRHNNRVDNLEWVSPKENVYHSFIYGQRRFNLDVPKVSRLTPYQISQIDFLRQYYSLKKVAELFNVPYTTMKNIVIKKKRLSHDNQQPSIYGTDYHMNEGSTTIPNGSTSQANGDGNALPE